MTTRTIETLDSVTDLPNIRRYNTRIKAIVHSHLSPYPIDVSGYVENCNVSKAIKGSGKAQVTLVAARNWINEIHPNDYINIYFDTGVGEGWTRTFCGFVDRVSESYAVSDNGTPMSRYVLSCSDFQKALELTQIYFNPHIANRRDLVASFIGSNNIGGLQLMMSGLNVTGSPADIVQSILLTMLGFGSQFILPASYVRAAGPYTRQRRIERAEHLHQTLPQDILRRIQDAGGFEQAVRDATTAAQQTDIVRGASNRTANSALLAGTRSAIQQALGTSVEQTGQVLTVASAMSDGALPTLLDIMDVFNFVEDGAIDGYMTSATIWQQQGSIMNFVMGHSNEMVNELFFDLRAVDSDVTLSESPYSREPDELEGNVTPEGTTGVRYVPAMVMREYPFSTIKDIDARNVQVLDGYLGIVPFGAIFSDRPNVPGRHIVSVPSIAIKNRGRGIYANKHLDVVTLSAKEVRSSDVGRSDHDHFNFTEFYSDNVNGSAARFFMSDIIPITSPIHIARHGLRVRSMQTQFARYGSDTIPATSQQLAEVVDDPAEGVDDATVPAVLPEDPLPSDIPRGAVWRGLRTLAQAYGVGLNVYLLARTIHSEYAFTSDTIDDANLVPGWAAINIARTGRRAGGGRRPFGTDSEGRDVFFTTNIGRAICPNGILGEFGGNRPQSTRQFPGDLETVEATQAAAQAGRFRLLLSASERALVDRYFDLAKRMLRGDSDVRDPAPRGFTVTFKHRAPIDPEKVANFQRNGHEIYELPPAPGSTAVTYGVAYTRDEPEVEEPAEDAPQSTAPVDGAQTTGAIDTSITRSQIIRWALLHDHWYQHNLEYLSGSLMIRPAPEIRVGYRLDLMERNLSFYVEGVSHTWQYPNVMHTNVQVTRGQPNDPHPVYVLPAADQFDTPAHQRQLDSRLGSFFAVPDLLAVKRAIMVKDGVVQTGTFTPKETDTDEALERFDEEVVRAGESREDFGETDAERAARERLSAEAPAERGGVQGLDGEGRLTQTQLADAVSRALTRIQDI